MSHSPVLYAEHYNAIAKGIFLHLSQCRHVYKRFCFDYTANNLARISIEIPQMNTILPNG